MAKAEAAGSREEMVELKAFYTETLDKLREASAEEQSKAISHMQQLDDLQVRWPPCNGHVSIV